MARQYIILLEKFAEVLLFERTAKKSTSKQASREIDVFILTTCH